jgi:hypothetical protein
MRFSDRAMETGSTNLGGDVWPCNDDVALEISLANHHVYSPSSSTKKLRSLALPRAFNRTLFTF